MWYFTLLSFILVSWLQLIAFHLLWVVIRINDIFWTYLICEEWKVSIELVVLPNLIKSVLEGDDGIGLRRAVTTRSSRLFRVIITRLLKKCCPRPLFASWFVMTKVFPIGHEECASSFLLVCDWVLRNLTGVGYFCQSSINQAWQLSAAKRHEVRQADWCLTFPPSFRIVAFGMRANHGVLYMSIP